MDTSKVTCSQCGAPLSKKSYEEDTTTTDVGIVLNKRYFCTYCGCIFEVGTLLRYYKAEVNQQFGVVGKDAHVIGFESEEGVELPDNIKVSQKIDVVNGNVVGAKISRFG